MYCQKWYLVVDSLSFCVLNSLNTPPFIPPQARGGDFWIYAASSIYSKSLASEPFSFRFQGVFLHFLYQISKLPLQDPLSGKQKASFLFRS